MGNNASHGVKGDKINEREEQTIQDRIDELEKQNRELLEIIQRNENKPSSKENSKEKLTKSAVNKAIIRKYIKDMLEDDNANVAWLPDFVERKIYENVFTLILGLVETNIKETSIQILGHKIKLSLQEQEKEDCDDNDNKLPEVNIEEEPETSSEKKHD